MNAGTKINEIIKSQGFDHHEYENVRLWSVTTGLQMQINTQFYYVLQDGTQYSIVKGLHKDKVLAESVEENKLAETLKMFLTSS